MEVHHSSTTSRQKWKHYFWEFFMLFLAISLGFFVENLREHRIARKQEKKFMQSFKTELSSDLSRIAAFQSRRLKKIQLCDSLIQQLSGPVLARNNSQVYFAARQISRRDHFYPQDAGLQQLKGVSGFQVIHDQEVLDSIGSYELLIKLNQENIDVEEKELTEYTDKAAKIFNITVFETITRENNKIPPPGNPALMTNDPMLINELCIKLHYWKRTALTIVSSLAELESAGRNLVNLIKEKYHLD